MLGEENGTDMDYHITLAFYLTPALEFTTSPEQKCLWEYGVHVRSESFENPSLRKELIACLNLEGCGSSSDSSNIS